MRAGFSCTSTRTCRSHIHKPGSTGHNDIRSPPLLQWRRVARCPIQSRSWVSLVAPVDDASLAEFAGLRWGGQNERLLLITPNKCIVGVEVRRHWLLWRS